MIDVTACRWEADGAGISFTVFPPEDKRLEQISCRHRWRPGRRSRPGYRVTVYDVRTPDIEEPPDTRTGAKNVLHFVETNAEDFFAVRVVRSDFNRK